MVSLLISDFEVTVISQRDATITFMSWACPLGDSSSMTLSFLECLGFGLNVNRVSI